MVVVVVLVDGVVVEVAPAVVVVGDSEGALVVAGAPVGVAPSVVVVADSVQATATEEAATRMATRRKPIRLMVAS